MKLEILVGMVAVAGAACGSDSNHAIDAAIDSSIDAVPTAAALPDLRFKFVGAFPSYVLGNDAEVEASSQSLTSAQTLFAPTQLGGGGAAESNQFQPKVLIEPATSTLTSVPIADASTTLMALLAADVVTAIDYGTADVALSYQVSAANKSQQFSTVADVAGLTSFASSVAVNGFVVTALGYNGSTIQVLAYSRAVAGDTYTTSVVAATSSTIAAQAATLAAGGYTITAVGRTSGTTSDFALVGTRPSVGTAPARSAMVTETPADALVQGYAIVGAFFDPAATTGNGHQYILEK